MSLNLNLHELVSGPTYQKINSLYLRDEAGRLLIGKFCLPEFAYLAPLPWEWSEKVDGTNLRIHVFPNGYYNVKGKTDAAQMFPGIIEAIRGRIGDPSERRLAGVFSHEATIYCEGYGGNIQKGAKYRSSPDVVMLDIRVGGWFLQRAALLELSEKVNIPLVPVVMHAPIKAAEELVLAPDFVSEWGSFKPEGLVGKPLFDLQFRSGHRILTKIKVKDYLRAGEGS